MRRLLWFLLLLQCYSSFGQTHRADSLQKTLLSHPVKDTTRVNILNELAFEFQFHTPSKALNYGLDARELARELNYGKGLAMANRFIGLAFWVQSDYATSLEFFLKGLHVADSLQLVQLQADLNGNIGLVYSGMGDYKRALMYFKSSLIQQRMLKNVKRQVVMLNNLGDSYNFLRNYDSALFFYNESLNLGKGINYLVETNKRNIGNVLEATGKNDLAMQYYSEAKAIGDKHYDIREMSQIRKSMASLYLSLQRPFDAEREAKSALDIASKGNYRAIIRDSYELLYRIALSRKQFEQALTYYRNYSLYKDSLQNLTEASRVASQQLDFEMKRKQAEIASLGKMNAERLKSRNTIIVFSTIAILLLLFLLINALRNFRAEKILNLELAQKNEEIIKQRQELARQHDEVLALNEEIRAQQDEVIAQLDSLMEHNQRIEALHGMLRDANQNLERMVVERTRALVEQNKKLEEYAFINAHRLRSPVANILGLINILELKHLEEERSEILDHLKKSAWELDQVVRNISNTLHQGLSAYTKEHN